MSQAVIGRQQAGATAIAILGAITFCHFLNDVATSLLPAIYPMLKSSFDLSFAQIGVITLIYQGIASLLQPVVGLYTDHRPQPYSLPFGMTCTLLGLAVLAFAPSFLVLLAGAALLGIGSAIFHPESSRLARLASGGAHGFAQSLFQVGGNFGNSLAPLIAAFFILPRGQAESRLVRLAGARRHRSADGGGTLVQKLRPWRAESRTVGGRSLGAAGGPGPPRHRGARRLDLLQVLLPVEHHQLLHFLSDAPLRAADGEGAALPVRLPRLRCGRNFRRRPDRRPHRPEARHLGVDPRRAALHPGAALCRAAGDDRPEHSDRPRAVVGLFGDRRLCPGADAGTRRHGVGTVLRPGIRHGRHRRRGLGRARRLDQHRLRLSDLLVFAADRAPHRLPARRSQ